MPEKCRVMRQVARRVATCFAGGLAGMLVMLCGVRADTQTVNVEVTLLDAGCEITVDNATPTLDAVNTVAISTASAVQRLGSFNLQLTNCFGSLASGKYLNVGVNGTTVKDDKVFRTGGTSGGAGFVLFWNRSAVDTYANALATTKTDLAWPGSSGANLATLTQTSVPVTVGAVSYGTTGVTGGTLTGAASFALSVK